MPLTPTLGAPLTQAPELAKRLDLAEARLSAFADVTPLTDFPDVPAWAWELNGAGDPATIWVDHQDSGSEERAAHRIDAGFMSGTWVLRLTLPDDLNDVVEDMHPALIVMGLSDAGRRLEDKLVEAVGLCRRRGLSWERIAAALGVTKQSAWRRFSTFM